MKNLCLSFLLGAVVSLSAVFFVNQHAGIELLPPDVVLPDSGHYQGDVENGLFHGHGRIVWRDNAVYIGTFKNGLFDGNGYLTWPNGDEYEGEFQQGLMHGKGILSMSGGSVYEGEFIQDEITGAGTFTYNDTDNTIYNGQLLDGLAHGTGELTTSSYTYKGEFKDNNFEGLGEQHFDYGDIYTGSYKNGLYHGQGKYVTADGRIYEGEFVDGSFTGEGKYTDKEGTKYVGEFVDWGFEGKGNLVNTNGDKYIGEFKYGSLDGDGEFISNDGEHYVGQFQYGEYDGEGTLTYAEPLDGIKTVHGKFDYGDLVETDDIPNFQNAESNNETALYNQNTLLQAAWEQITENTPNEIDMYFLGIAGDGTQAVFRREIDFVQHLFDEKFATDGKSIKLVNSKTTIPTTPLATQTSINQTLSTIANKMDENEDILFVYMTSHGSKDFKFYLNQEDLALPNLPAEDFATTINKLPVKWKVIVISACYSGGFIPYLKNENTLVITAANHKRTSFGCGDKNDFTYFGEAYFSDALSETDDFITAFDIAKNIIQEREQAKDIKPSKPQIFVGNAVKEHLKKWQEQRLRQIKPQVALQTKDKL